MSNRTLRCHIAQLTRVNRVQAALTAAAHRRDPTLPVIAVDHHGVTVSTFNRCMSRSVHGHDQFGTGQPTQVIADFEEAPTAALQNV